MQHGDELRGRQILFASDPLEYKLQAIQRQASRRVNDIPEDQFLIAEDQQIVDHIVADSSIQPLVLQENAAVMHKAETHVDVSSDEPNRVSVYGTFGFSVPGTRINVDIPFSGDEWLLYCRISRSPSVVPEAEVLQGNLRISISLPHDADPEKFKENYQGELDILKDCVKESHNQVIHYNQCLPQLIRQAITSRRERLRKHAGIAELLNIPLTTREGAPSITPVKIKIRRPSPLPVPPKTGLVPEPGIDDEDYEHILHFIRHQGRTFERTPGTYAMHGEEDLRNIILAQLNGHFKGEAAGEVFRRRGKTDICIEQDNRAAFIGECKLWSGPFGLAEALEQLLGYLTWRDSKASLIIFNLKNKNFSKILEAVPETVKRHPLYVRDLPCEESGEWRVQMHSEEDEGRRVIVHLFVFNLYQSS